MRGKKRKGKKRKEVKGGFFERAYRYRTYTA